MQYSMYLCTIVIPFGKLKYKHIPMRLKSLKDFVQEAKNISLRDMRNATPIEMILVLFQLVVLLDKYPI